MSEIETLTYGHLPIEFKRVDRYGKLPRLRSPITVVVSAGDRRNPLMESVLLLLKRVERLEPRNGDAPWSPPEGFGQRVYHVAEISTRKTNYIPGPWLYVIHLQDWTEEFQIGGFMVSIKLQFRVMEDGEIQEVEYSF